MHSLKQASQIDPNREETYLEFSTICADHGNDQLALDSAEIGLSHVPASYRLTVQKGVEEAKLRRRSDAEATLGKAVGMQKDNSVALLSLAVVQAQSGRPAEAEETLTSSLRRFPNNFYMDPWTFNQKNLMKCCKEFLLSGGKQIPFCAYNSVGYREQARAQLEAMEPARGRARRTGVPYQPAPVEFDFANRDRDRDRQPATASLLRIGAPEMES